MIQLTCLNCGFLTIRGSVTKTSDTITTEHRCGKCKAVYRTTATELRKGETISAEERASYTYMMDPTTGVKHPIPRSPRQCEALSPHGARCGLPNGHSGRHSTQHTLESWDGKNKPQVSNVPGQTATEHSK